MSIRNLTIIFVKQCALKYTDLDDFTEYVQVVALDPSCPNVNDNHNGKVADVSGWGRISDTCTL